MAFPHLEIMLLKCPASAEEFNLLSTIVRYLSAFMHLATVSTDVIRLSQFWSWKKWHLYCFKLVWLSFLYETQREVFWKVVIIETPQMCYNSSPPPVRNRLHFVHYVSVISDLCFSYRMLFCFTFLKSFKRCGMTRWGRVNCDLS